MTETTQRGGAMQLPQPAPGARVLAFGGYQPGNVVTNGDLAAAMDTSDE